MSEWKEIMLQDVVSVLGDGLHGTPIYDETSMKNLFTHFRRSEGLLRRMPSAKSMIIMRVPYDLKKKFRQRRTGINI